jgi:hypothetical protein
MVLTPAYLKEKNLTTFITLDSDRTVDIVALAVGALQAASVKPLPIISLAYVVTGDGVATTSGSWLQRVLNTILHDDTGLVTLVANQFKLPAGTYIALPSHFNWYNAGNVMTRLYNATQAASILISGTEFVGNDAFGVTGMMGGAVTSNGVDLLELDYICATSDGNGQGLGATSNPTGSGLTSWQLCKINFLKLS